MAWSGGVYTQQAGGLSGDDICQEWAGDGDPTIYAPELDSLFEDHAEGINQCINKDGSNAFTSTIDAGNNPIANLTEAVSTGQAGRWDEDIASVGLDGTVLEITLNDGQELTVDLASVGSVGEVTITGDQTISGSKTLTGTTVASDLKTDGPIRHALENFTTSATITCDTDAGSRFYIANNQAMTVTLDLTDAADSDLGDYWASNGWIMFDNGGSAGVVTIACPNADDLEIIGSNPTGNNDTYTLAYNIVYLNGTVRVQGTWVTPE